MFNPDGRDRFVNWVNGNRGLVPTSDIQDREHNQPWPRGRTNHYLFDLNRDWMPVTQPESEGRVKLFISGDRNFSWMFMRWVEIQRIFFNPVLKAE